MDISNKNEQPLLVVHYVWWRILWRLFIPYIPGAFMFYGFGGYFVRHGNPIAYITMYLLMLFGIGMAVSLILTKDFCFYSDRMEKRWFLLGTHMLNYDEISVGLTYTNMRAFNFRTIAFQKKLQHIYFILRLDRNLVNKETEQEVIRFLAEISHRDISDFQENVALKPFIKELQKE
jgi:hypothetical protein